MKWYVVGLPVKWYVVGNPVKRHVKEQDVKYDVTVGEYSNFSPCTKNAIVSAPFLPKKTNNSTDRLL